ncbi:MAG: hypothetical protein ACI8UR_001024 [Natronomonas sp.]|jgi:hypothetical protein|uniref:hypothetical protein n=1 Tax=Natronomonas sp. TaxID=2184060 RepID=UPI003989C909
MNRTTLLKTGGIVVGFFLLGQAARSVVAGQLLIGGLGAFIGIVVLLAALRLD